ncbi:hypothetical protein N8I74_08185 [Chitiniphilus purpureus]|uniref:Uncharacterized protein n=1 Tax=Chitiniphilus purpureus TaxID=2981137 RepID=A0ABY6DRH7_9NEIS|nr:hypothetical protein [Chitiniphilus sp. CD1]UXY16975.1 hypothetical protein N8I74_08185 [Chitiniphilus sp. CD1]
MDDTGMIDSRSGKPIELEEVQALLRARYTAPAWLLVMEPVHAGDAGQKAPDVMAMRMSRGMDIWEFQIEVDRCSWLKARRRPTRAGSLSTFCDRRWIVAPAGVVQEGELPSECGLLEVVADGLVIARKAPLLPAKQLTKAFMARMLFLAGTAKQEMIDAAARAAVADALEHGKAQLDRDIAVHTSRYRELLAELTVIRELTGLEIGGSAKWRPTAEVAAIIRMAVTTDIFSAHNGISAILRDAARLQARLAESTEALREGVAQLRPFLAQRQLSSR